KLDPDVVVLDLMMPELGGLEAARQIASRGSERPRIVVLSMHSNEAYVWEALRAGATAYVLKDCGASELAKAIRAAAAGVQYFSETISEESVQAYARKAGEGGPDPVAPLTAREREVLRLTAEGLSSATVAERLYISPRTVESHRASIMRKLNLR